MQAASLILYLLVLVVWVGSHVAFRLLLAGVIFKKLNSGEALKVLRLVLPRLCIIGWLAAPAGIVLVSLMLADGKIDRLAGILSVLALAAMAATTLALRQPVIELAKLPEGEIQRAAAMDEDLSPEAQKQWLAIGALTIKVNAVQLLLGLVLIVAFVLGGLP
jgi:hypothetical protein